MLENIQDKLKELHGIEIVYWQFIDRPYMYPLFTAIATDIKGNRFFIKESKNFVPSDYLEELYESLEVISEMNLNICFPLKDRTKKYAFVCDEKVFHLFKYIEIKDLDPDSIDFNNVIGIIEKFHSGIKDMKLPLTNKIEYLSFPNWLMRPLDYLPPVIGEDHPFIMQYSEFYHDKLPKIKFSTSPIFWDISRENICMDKNLNIWLLDFELVHNGATFSDFIRTAGMYLKCENNTFSISPEIFNFLIEKSRQITNISDPTLIRFLLVRSVLRNVRGVTLPEQKKELDDYLMGALNFCIQAT